MSKWLMHAETDWRFARDSLNLLIAFKDGDGVVHRVKPFAIEVDDSAIPEGTVSARDDHTVELPTELAYLLFDHLARLLFSTEGDTVATIRRLERDVAWYKSNLEKLIAGIGRLGGVER